MTLAGHASCLASSCRVRSTQARSSCIETSRPSSASMSPPCCCAGCAFSFMTAGIPPPLRRWLIPPLTDRPLRHYRSTLGLRIRGTLLITMCRTLHAIHRRILSTALPRTGSSDCHSHLRLSFMLQLHHLPNRPIATVHTPHLFAIVHDQPLAFRTAHQAAFCSAIQIVSTPCRTGQSCSASMPHHPSFG